MTITILKPSYYDSFFCLGPQCQFTCCQGWGILLSKNEYTHIKNLKKPKELEILTKKAFRRKKKDETSKQYANVKFNEDNRCMLLTDNQLCSLQQACGHKALPHTCQVFPRSNTLTSVNEMTLLEQHLSLGCEAVVKLLMDLPDGITFQSYTEDNLSTKLNDINYSNSSLKAKERPIHNFSWDIKTLGVDTLQNRSLPLEDRMLLLGIAFQSIHQMESEGKEEEIPSYIKSFLAMMNDPSLLTGFRDIKGNSNIKVINALYFFDIIQIQPGLNFINIIYDHLGILKCNMITKSDLEKDPVYETSMEYDQTKYHTAKTQFTNFIKGREYILENIMVSYFLFNNYPFYKSDRNIWDHYLLFVSIYHFLIFALTGYLTENSTDEDFIYATTVCSRALTHTPSLFDSIVDHLKETKSDTLAHMAILIK